MRTPEWIRSQDVDETGRERINWWRVLLLVGGLVACVTFLVYLIADRKGADEKEVPEKIFSRWKEPDISFDAEADEPDPVVAKPVEIDEEEQEEEKKSEPDPRIEIMARLGQERISSFQMDHKRVAAFQEVSSASGYGACDIMPGTIAKLRPESPINTDNGGAVTAILAEPVPGSDGCIALEAGARFVGMVDTNVNFGQSRANVVFASITTSDGRVVNIQEQAGDAVGGGGVPGKVNRHLGSKFAGVAVATAVDLAGFAFAGGGKGYGIIVGNSGGVLDDFARQFVNRKDTISVDPTQTGKLLTVTFTQKVSP